MLAKLMRLTEEVPGSALLGPNPRGKFDDDGVLYADPSDFMDERE